MIWTQSNMYSNLPIHFCVCFCCGYALSQSNVYSIFADLHSYFVTLQEEFTRCAQLLPQIESGQVNWHALFLKSEFFSRYRVYVRVDMSASSADEQRQWSGFVQSRLRHLVLMLEVSVRMYVNVCCRVSVRVDMSTSSTGSGLYCILHALPWGRVLQLDCGGSYLLKLPWSSDHWPRLSLAPRCD